MTTAICNSNSSLPEYWEQAYQSGEIAWDIGAPTPIFNKWIKSQTHSFTICVLGAGNGWDALNFAKQGHTVTAVDFASSAIENMRKSAKDLNVNLNLVHSDIFDLYDILHSKFDIVLEYTCYCAIDPDRRTDYVELVSYLLKPEGMLVALFFPTDKELNDDGPPYGVELDETLLSFSKYFKVVEQKKPLLSIERRNGREMFVILKKYGN